MTSTLDRLRAVRERVARAPGARLREIDRAIAVLERSPCERVERAIAALYSALAPLLPCSEEPICPGYPRAPRDIQARLVLGERPDQILRGLTRREAHEALSSGFARPQDYLCSLLVPCPTTTVRDVAVARWLTACWRDPQRRAALEREHVERGPHGEEIRGRYIDRIDEISAKDLARGEKTSVREAFASAAKRAYERWAGEAETQHEPLAPPPAWWRPVRCARILLSAAQLVAEGRDMHHCVGSYAPYVRRRQSVIVALCVRTRDATYRSTVELARDKPTVRQHKGPGNATPHMYCRRALDVCLRRWSEQAA